MDTIDIDLTDIAHGGTSVGHHDGRAVFARFGLPGERVQVKVTKEKAKLIQGDVVAVIGDPSPHRVEHPWPTGGPLGVGGAELGHVAFGYQSQWKTHVLQATIRRIGGEEFTNHLEEQGISPVVESFAEDARNDGWHSRTRIEFVVGENGAPAMYREGTHELIELKDQPLGVEEIEDLDLFSGAWRKFWAPGDRIRAIVPSGSDPVVVVGKQVFAFPGIEAEPYIREDVVVGRNLYSYRVHATGFWQVHRSAGSQIVSMVMNGARPQPGENIVELYSGSGLLTQPLALAVGSTGSVRAFESARLAVEDARANLRDMPWAKARTSNVDAKLVEWEPGDVVVADPPRSGLGLDVARALAGGPARRIVLVSCDPAAMARDVAAMVSAGRKVTSMTSIDMFPNTHHFEVVTALD